MFRTLFRLALALSLTGLVVSLLPDRGEAQGWSLFPPLCAILVAVSTGRLVLGLSIAVLSGAALSLPASTPFYVLPWAVIRHAAVDFFWIPLVKSFQFYILGFTAALIGMMRGENIGKQILQIGEDTSREQA